MEGSSFKIISSGKKASIKKRLQGQQDVAEDSLDRASDSDFSVTGSGKQNRAVGTLNLNEGRALEVILVCKKDSIYVLVKTSSQFLIHDQQIPKEFLRDLFGIGSVDLHVIISHLQNAVKTSNVTLSELKKNK